MSGELERQTSSDVAVCRVKVKKGPGKNRKATVPAREVFVVYLLPSGYWHCGIPYGIKTCSLLYDDMRGGLWITPEPWDGRG